METLDIFHDDPRLEDERVLLRRLQPDDIDLFLPFAEQEPEIWKYSIVRVDGESNMRAYVENALKNYEEKKEFPFIVFDKKLNAYGGSTRFYDIQQSASTTQLGYTWYGRDFQRTGLNRHCKFLLLSYVFEKWGLERCEFRADANNARSIAAMKAIGCKEEGILRNHLPLPDGSRRSSIVLSILRDEWFGCVREHLQQLLRD